MTEAPSIRQRLSRVVLKVSLAWSLAVFGVVWIAVHQQVDVVLDGALQESAEIIFGLLKVNADRLPRQLEQGDQVMPAPPHHERMVWQLVGADGHVLLRSHNAPAEALGLQHADRWLEVNGNWHVFGLPFDDRGTMLYVGQSHGDRRRAQLGAALITASGALMVGAACAWWLRRRAGHELDPLVALSRQVAAYHPLDAGTQPLVATRQELRPLSDAIETLGERLAAHVASERAFSAHAAHALRTPLAGLGMQLAMAQRESPPPAQARIQRARQAADRLGRVVTALLSLFRSGGELHVVDVALGPLIRDLPVEGLAITVSGDTAHTVRADPDLLAAALLNLLDNAVRYGARQVQCTLGHDAVSGLSWIRLDDDGPGVDPERRARIVGALADRHEGDDMGLGLMLADRVARVHGGQLSLPEVAQGFAVQMSLRPMD